MRFLSLPEAIACVEEHETDQCQCRRKAQAECHYQKQPVGGLIERDGGKEQYHRGGAGDKPSRDPQGQQTSPTDLPSVRPGRQVRVHAAAVRMRQQRIVIVLIVMAVRVVIVRLAMSSVRMVMMIKVHVIIVAMCGVGMMLMRMLGVIVRISMRVRMARSGMRAGARRLRRAPALPQQNDPHPQHQQTRYQAQDGKQALGHEEARSGKSCEPQNEDAERMSKRHGNPEKQSMPRRPTRADQIRADDSLAVTGRKCVSCAKY